MMDYIYIGKIVNTHGIKGELRIKSDFELKNIFLFFLNFSTIFFPLCFLDENIILFLEI